MGIGNDIAAFSLLVQSQHFLFFMKIYVKAIMTVDKAGHDPIPEVAAHWKSIVDGKVPFGYEVWND